MARYDSDMRKLKREVQRLKEELAHSFFPSSLKEYGLTKVLPDDNDKLRDLIINWYAGIEAMIDTLPGQGYEPHPGNIRNHKENKI